jgi:hypothetical protein
MSLLVVYSVHRPQPTPHHKRHCNLERFKQPPSEQLSDLVEVATVQEHAGPIARAFQTPRGANIIVGGVRFRMARSVGLALRNSGFEHYMFEVYLAMRSATSCAILMISEEPIARKPAIAPCLSDSDRFWLTFHLPSMTSIASSIPTIALLSASI